MTASITEMRLVPVAETLCLPDEREPEWKHGLYQKERARNNAALKQKLWSYVRHHGL
jgi:hypothetical protein